MRPDVNGSFETIQFYRHALGRAIGHMTGNAIVPHRTDFRRICGAGSGIIGVASHAFLVEIGGVTSLLFMRIMTRTTIHFWALDKAFASGE